VKFFIHEIECARPVECHCWKEFRPIKANNVMEQSRCYAANLRSKTKVDVADSQHLQCKSLSKEACMRSFKWLGVVLLIASLVSPGSSIGSEQVEIWHGWMNITPCSRASGYEDDFGNWWPNGVEWADQELHGHIFAIVPSAQDLTNEVQNACIQCGMEAAAVTTAAAILTSGAGGWPAFGSAFWNCINGRSSDYVQRVLGDIRLETSSQCNW